MSRLPDATTDRSRGVSTIIGFVLLFGIVVITLTLYQAQVVPQQNSEVEFEHYQTVQEDMNELRTTHINTIESGQERAASVSLGALYPSRVVAVNPSPIEGTLRSESLGEIELRTGGDQYNLSTLCGEPPQTTAIRYETAYTELSDGEAFPITYENSVLYRTTPEDGAIVDSDQLLLDETTINLLPLQTNVSETGLTTSVELASDSFGPEKSLTNEKNITLTVPTLNPEVWAEQVLDDVDGVEKVTTGDGEINVTLTNPPETEDDDKWSVQCAIATNDDEVPEAPDSQNNDQEELGVGAGGTSNFGSNTSEDTFTAPNGKWFGITNIARLELSDGEPARLTGSQGADFQGDVVQLSFKLRDGRTGEQITTDVLVSRQPGGGFNTRTVQFTDENGNNQNLDLTAEAANRFYNNGTVDILNESNYGSNFQYGSGNFGWFVERIQQMRNATWQTSQIAGRTDVRIIRGQPLLTMEEFSRNQAIGEEDAVTFTATVENVGAVTETQNIDLLIRNDGQRIQSALPYADRETVTLASNETTQVTLTWVADDDVDTGEYEAIVEGEDDRTHTSVYVTDNTVLKTAIQNVTTPIERGDPFNVTATVTNIGPNENQKQSITMELDSNGNDVASDSVPGIQLDPGESTLVAFDGIDTVSHIGSDSTGEMAVTVGASSDNIVPNETVVPTETVAVIEKATVVTNASVTNVDAGEDEQEQTFTFELDAPLKPGDEVAIDLTGIGPDLEYSAKQTDWTVVDSSDGSGKVNSIDSNNDRVQRALYKIGNGDTVGDEIAVRTTVDAEDADEGTLYSVPIWVKSSNDFAEGPQAGDRTKTEFNTE